jgi:5-(carboxyamino)imidazole ribonucleotide synthase
VRIGILGGGQLGRMLALAGFPLGYQFRFLDGARQVSAADLGEVVMADFRDFNALARFADDLDLVTYEFENVPIEAAEFLAARLPVYPPPKALGVAQDRWQEKQFFTALDIPAPPTAAVASLEELEAALERIGLPAVLKTRRLGYDGKGQRVIRARTDVERAWRELGGRELVLEQFVAFDRELSIIAVRGRDGVSACYPLTENEHEDGILHISIAPAPGIDDVLQREAERCATAVLDALDYVGVLAIELFERDGELLANELAPRVHNSGHWTIEGAVASQFENHLRAITGLPLGLTDAIGHCAMVNLIGTAPDAQTILAVPGAHLHLYGKQQRPRRKIGHVTLGSRSADDTRARLDQLLAIIGRS